MADEEDENQPKSKKKEEKDLGPELAPGDVINPVEYKMFDKMNMLKTLNIPGKAAYSFQKELSNTVQKRLEAVRQRLGADDVDPISDNVKMELMAGLQSWEEVDPKTGQLIELRDAEAAKILAKEPKTDKSEKPKGPPLPNVTPSVVAVMRSALPKPKQEDKSAMPAANRRILATPTKFEGMLKAMEKAEFGDYYETIEKWDRQWKAIIGKRPSELKPPEKLEVVKGKDDKDVKKKASSFVQQAKTSSFFKEKGDMGATARASVIPRIITQVPSVALPVVKKVKSLKKPAGTPAFLDGLVEYFLANVSPDCDLEAWLTPVNIVPVFKIREIPPDIENCVLTIARVTHSKFIDDQEIASQIRSALETFHGYACRWHVIVGRKFGLQVNADKGNFLFMYIGHLGYVVFRTFG